MLVLSLCRIPVNIDKCEGIPTKFIEEIVLHDWLVICQRGQYSHLGCDFSPIECQDCLSGGLEQCLVEVRAIHICLVGPGICKNC